MKIMTLNIQNGGEVEVIDHNMENIDVLVMNEFQLKNKTAFKNKLNLSKFVFFQGPDVPAEKDQRNSVFIASKVQVSSKSKPSKINKTKHFWEECFISDIYVLAVYIPTDGGVWGKSKSIMWNAIIDRASEAKEKNQKLIILGDLNTAMAEDCQNDSTTFDKYIADLKKLGFIDAWEVKHKDCESNDRWTWYSSNANGKRLDYVFLSPALKNSLKSAEHLHGYRINDYTDHSAVLVELQ